MFERIKDKNESIENNLEEMIREGYKLDMFRPETLEKMVENIDYTMRIFVKGA